MKKILSVLFVGLLASTALPIESLVVKNATNGTVFAVGYETGVATVTVAGAISPSSISASGNATVGGTLGVTGIATFAATQTVWSAAAAVSTNTVATSVPALPVRVNGTNYLIRLVPN